MDNVKVTAFAKSKGYDEALFFKDWKGYRVYILEKDIQDDGENIPVTGLPVFALEKNGKIRAANADENSDLFLEYASIDDDDEDDDE